MIRYSTPQECVNLYSTLERFEVNCHSLKQMSLIVLYAQFRMTLTNFKYLRI